MACFPKFVLKCLFVLKRDLTVRKSILLYKKVSSKVGTAFLIDFS